MRASDIQEELIEATGSCDEAMNLRTLTRAIQLLANRGLFDPLLGTIDFTIAGGYWIALPRDVKTPIRLNINNNPSISRNRLFEYAPNTEGSVDGEEVGWQWHERGYSPIQNEVNLPSVLSYIVTDSGDVGKTITIVGTDTNGYERKEVLVGNTINPTASEFTYGEVKSVIREPTAREVFLYSANGAIARYYPDEEQPEYRVVKLSKTGVAVRMLYRKHIFKITSWSDVIPLHSEMAVIRAVKAVRLMQRDQTIEADAVLESAVKMIKEEQESRDENTTVAGVMEIQTVINTNINTNDVLIVADIYDMASDIFGPIGRAKLFDRITDAINLLGNKSQWDSMIGNATLNRVSILGEETETNRRRDGYFVLPRYVGAVLAVNTNGQPGMPRNRWFEFHLNGTGDTRYASCGTWDDAGDTVIINRLPRVSSGVGSCWKTAPAYVIAKCENGLDEDSEIRIYGIEQLADGREVEVMRDGIMGWLCPCAANPLDDGLVGAPKFVRIDRITRAATVGFVSLFTVEQVVIPPPTISDSDETEVIGDEDAPTLTLPIATWDNDPESLTLYGTSTGVGPFGWAIDLFDDEDKTNLVAHTEANFGDENVAILNGTAFGGITFLLNIEGMAATSGDFNFTIVRTFVAEHPGDETYENTLGSLLGYWYPDEIEPRYRMIKVAGCGCSRIRIRYRKRSNKITSLHDVINLRTRVPLENMMRAIANQSTDPVKAAQYEGFAVSYIEEEQAASNPIAGGSLQFDPGTSPGWNQNIS